MTIFKQTEWSWKKWGYTTLSLRLYFCISAPPELYTDATKQFASSFISKQEVVVTEPVTTFTLAPNNCAFGISDSTLTLTKFRLPQANEKVRVKQFNMYLAFVNLKFDQNPIKCS